MKLFRYTYNIIAILTLFALFACTEKDNIFAEGGESVTVTFRPTIAHETNTRAIGDATGIDQLVVAVYEGEDVLSQKLYIEKDWTIAERDGVQLTLTLLEGHKYNVLFWAQNQNSAYTIEEDGKISVDYTNYRNGGFAKMEQMDAFCGTSTITVGSQPNKAEKITLARPLAQLNFADNATAPAKGTHKAVVTLTKAPTAYNPFAETVETSAEDVTFTFTDFPNETLSSNGNEYYYLSCNYLFAPVEVDITFELQNMDGSTLNSYEFSNVEIASNKKTNVYGSIVAQPEEWSVWDGTSKTEPELENGAYVIDEASDLAWLYDNAGTLSQATFVVNTDIDMNKLPGQKSIQMPAGSTIDGDEHTVKGLTTALLSEATNLTIKDLTIDDSQISSTATHVGLLANIVKGSATITNVTIQNSSATTTNGAAGGFVGYIVRTTEKDRNETLNVSFNGCKLNNVQVSASASEGKFVGLLSGYDNNESLSFDVECEADVTTTVADYVSTYTKANNSAWVTSDVTDKYNGWLGAEIYRRAKVTFAGVRMAPRWDGKTATAKADLLVYNGESNKYEVQSPSDLAGVRNATASPAALYLAANVDMHGQGADGKYNVPSVWTKSAYTSEDDNYFKSFSSIVYLDGNNNGIYNLNINTQKVSTSLYYGGFIQSTNGTTTHQNIKFYNCCIVVPHVVYKDEDKGSAGMLVSNIAGDSYTMDNVHTYGCKIFALQKVGGLAARVAATTSNISNCSVNNCYIENYECKDHLETFSGGNSLASVSTQFYSYGEVGGMFGFVEMNTTIDNAQVNGTTIYAFGQDDKAATKSGLAFILLNYYTVPGRHVGTFIGDIRTTTSGGGTITMTNISVDSNTKCINRWDKHNNKCETAGRAYFLYFKDDQGNCII